MLKQWFVAIIGKQNYVKHVAFATELYQSAFVPF